jgi:hypothetical protein
MTQLVNDLIELALKETSGSKEAQAQEAMLVGEGVKEYQTK